MTQQTITAERDVQLVKRSPLNPLRRLLRKPLPTYTAPLFAEALVTAEREADLPTLRIEEERQGRFRLAVIARPGAQFTIARVILRERGMNHGYFPTPPLVRRTAESDAQEAPSVPPGLSAAVFNPAFTGCEAPTHSSSVLHDLEHVAELLETAQFEIAMTPGGDAAGTPANSAWKALQALVTVRAKLDVMADAADLAAQEVADAQRRAETQRPDIDTGVKRNLNRAASMLRMVTDRLPAPKSKAV